MVATHQEPRVHHPAASHRQVGFGRVKFAVSLPQRGGITSVHG
jgi:hypothetical protein